MELHFAAMSGELMKASICSTEPSPCHRSPQDQAVPLATGIKLIVCQAGFWHWMCMCA